jgi:hypothetical protein
MFPLILCAQQPVPPANPESSTSQQGSDSKDKDKDKDKKKSGEGVGKSNLEKETGTVNDRIFEVLPNYGTVENAKELPPLTSKQKFPLASASAFDWGSFAFNAGLAGIAQAKNDPKDWGQGWDAYGRRYGASFADNNVGTYMTTAIFPSLLHEDPRYYQLGKRKFWPPLLSRPQSAVCHAKRFRGGRIQLLGSRGQCCSGGSLQHLPRRVGSHRGKKRQHVRFSDSVRRPEQ